MTRSQSEALDWLKKHNGDGMFDREGVLLAGGERAPFMRSTWNALRNMQAVEFYQVRIGGATRVRVVGGAA